MTTATNDQPVTVSPSLADTRLARESVRAIAKLLGADAEPVRVSVQREGGFEESVSLPASALRLLADILNEMAKGNSVTLLPGHAEMSALQAADLLNVSMRYLEELLRTGEIPSVATNRVLLRDLLDYKRKTDEQRLRALEELSALDQELGFGY